MCIRLLLTEINEALYLSRRHYVLQLRFHHSEKSKAALKTAAA
jgi:hypothetical protein